MDITQEFISKKGRIELSYPLDSIPANNVVRGTFVSFSTYSNDEKTGKLTSKRYEKNLYID